MIELRLPFPPSVNAMFLNSPNLRGKGRIPSPEYKAWKVEAGKELLLQAPSKIEGPVRITIDLDDTRRGDCDNRNKSILDLLVAHRVIEGDSKRIVRRVSIGWEQITGCRVRIERAA
jgi:Holliday junction resolvase RusA-like endonuclease